MEIESYKNNHEDIDRNATINLLQNFKNKFFTKSFNDKTRKNLIEDDFKEEISKTEKGKKFINLYGKILLVLLMIIVFIIDPYIFTQKDYLDLYIVTHKDFPNRMHNKYYKILCDNKEQLKNKYFLKIIDTHENNELYPKRIGYCEGSKIYYIWKNYKLKNITVKYVGFNHYRRIFYFRNHIPDLDEIFSKNDVILYERVTRNQTIKELYSLYHFSNFLEEILEIIKNKFPEYYQTAIDFFNGKSINYCNIFIMKREDFIKYGEFVFGILLEFDRLHNLKSDNDIKRLILKEIELSGKKYDINYQCRQQGFLLERISNVFYSYHFKNKLELSTRSL